MDIDPCYYITEGSNYLMSLDALDLSLLPTIYTPRSRYNAGLLWSSKTSIPVGKDYFKFEIKSNCDVDDDITTEESSETICYICNIVVPNDYISEHLNSLKHISYQKITETAVERIKKHKQLVAAQHEKSGLEYFCEHCVSKIYSSNRHEHEKSETHKNFEAVDTFLKNFALLYTNSGDIFNQSIAKRERDYEKIDISPLKVNENISEEVNVVKGNVLEVVPLRIYNNNNKSTHRILDKDTASVELKLKDSVDLISNIKSCMENTLKEVNHNVTSDDESEEADTVNNLEQYIKHLEKYGTIKLHTVDLFNQDRLRIETSNGCELIVATFNFHGFKKLGMYLQCKLCKTIVKNAKDHIIIEKHMRIVAQPFIDKHGIRRLEDHWSHCVVCNEIIDNVAVHTQFNSHTKKVEQALVPNGKTYVEVKTKAGAALSATEIDITSNLHTADNYTVITLEKLETESKGSSIETNNDTRLKLCNEKIIRDTSNQYYCLICDTHMHINNVEKHMSGTKHIKNSKSKMYYLMSKDKNNSLTCKVCKVSVTYYAWAVEDHIATNEHYKNYNNCLKTNKIDSMKNGFFCKPCKKSLDVMTELSHIERNSHKINLASYNITCIDKKVNNDKIEHRLLYVDVNNDVSSKSNDNNGINNDGKGAGNSDEYANILPQNNIIISDSKTKLNCEQAQNNISPTGSASYKCEACKIGIVNNSSIINAHKDSTKHKTMDVLVTGVNNLLETLLKSFNNPPEIDPHLEQTNLENLLNCKICTDKVLIEDSEKHTNGLKHIHKHRDLLTTNKLKVKNDHYICCACNVVVKFGKELRHIGSVEHDMRIESLKNGDYVLVGVDNKIKIDKVQHDLKVMESKNVENKPKVIKLRDFIPKYVLLTAKDSENMKQHFCDLIDNKKQLICVLCQELIENTANETHKHTNTIYHEEKYNIVMTYNQIFQTEECYVCGYCECLISGNELEHIVTDEHIANQKQYPNKNFCFTCKESTIDVGLKEHLTSSQHINNIFAPSQFYCSICDLQIKNYEDSVQRHNEGFEHQNNSLLIHENKVVLKNKKCACQVCGTSFSRDSLKDHIASVNHVMALHHS